MRLATATACLAIAALAIAGLIGRGTGDEELVGVAPPPETADPLPMLPVSWTSTVNAAGGYALGVPHGWSVQLAGERTTMRSPDGSVIVRVTADRTEAAVNAELDDYAEDVLANLGGEGEPEAQVAAAQAGYERATAIARADGRRRLEVIVLRRPELAAFPILVASDASVKPTRLDPVVERLVGSLRGRRSLSS